MTGESRTKIREGAACKEKSERERPAFEIAQVNNVTKFIGKGVVGHYIADGKRFNLAHEPNGLMFLRPINIGGSEGLNFFDPCIIAGHLHPKSHSVPCFEHFKLVRVLHLE